MPSCARLAFSCLKTGNRELQPLVPSKGHDFSHADAALLACLCTRLAELLWLRDTSGLAPADLQEHQEHCAFLHSALPVPENGDLSNLSVSYTSFCLLHGLGSHSTSACSLLGEFHTSQRLLVEGPPHHRAGRGVAHHAVGTLRGVC